MNQVSSKRILKFIVSMLLLAALVLPPQLISNVAQAAANPSIETKMTIGTGSIIGNYDYYSKEDGKYSLSVLNPVKNATYTFTSSNTKIVTVKASGSTVYLTGVKAGTANITCNQKIGKKTTKVGTCKVTVKNSSVSQDTIPVLPLGDSVAQEYLEYSYRNNDATYTFTCSNKNFSMKETIKKFDGMYFISQSFSAKAPGTYTVTVKETYNKSTRTVGTIKYIVKKATVVPEETLDLGSNKYAFELINNFRLNVDYLFVTEDENIVEGFVEEGTVYLKAKSVGTTNLTIYEDAATPDKSKLIGTCKLTVKEVILESLDFDLYTTETSVGGDDIDFEVYKNPYNALGTITVTSSDPSVATVTFDSDEGYGKITPVSEGTATITITCGDITKTQTINVNAAEVDDDE